MALVVGENSYISLEYAESYFYDRLNSDAWNNAGDNKSKALIMATKAIDRLRFVGIKASESQVLKFPRAYQVDPRNVYYVQQSALNNDYRYYNNGYYVIQEEVPQEVKDAACEEAFVLLDRGSSKRRKLQQEGVESFSLGNLSEQYAKGSGKGLLSMEAKELLKPLISGAVRIV